MKTNRMCFVQWCNDNNGFLSAVLSFIGLFVSVTAIFVSIQTARLPYKKKVILESALWGANNTARKTDSDLGIIGMAVSATNVGNRSLFITSLKYAVKTGGKYKELSSLCRQDNTKSKLAPSEIKVIGYLKRDLLAVL